MKKEPVKKTIKKEKNEKKESKTKKAIEKIFNLFIAKSLIFDVVITFLGLYFIINPFSGLRGCEIVFAIILIISGGFSIFDYASKGIIRLFGLSLIYGALSVVLGILILINPLALINVLTIVFGIWLIISGLMKIDYAIKLNAFKEESWGLTLVIGLLITIFGILVIVNPFINLYLTEVAGLFLIIYAILDFTNIVLFKKRATEITKLFK